MKKEKIKTLYIIIFCITFITLFTFVLSNKFILLNQNKKEIVTKKQNEKQEFFQDYLKNNQFKIKDLIQNRSLKIDDQKNIIMIGRNKKELENEYFDIKISLENNLAKISINKLFKDVMLDKERKVDENYLNEVINLINITFDLKLDSNNFLVLKSYLKDNYINIRNLENVENLKEKDTIKKITILNYKVEFKLEDNILNFYISF